MNDPWTHEELQEKIPAMKQFVESEINRLEAEHVREGGEEIKPLPPLTKDECLTYMFRLMDSGSKKPLTSDEYGLFGQLISQFEQATIAEALGKKGRYYVISEEQIQSMASKV